MAKRLGIVSATYVPQGMSLEDTINVIIGASRFDNTQAGHDSRATAKDSEIVNVALAVKWGIYINPKTKEVRLLYSTYIDNHDNLCGQANVRQANAVECAVRLFCSSEHLIQPCLKLMHPLKLKVALHVLKVMPYPFNWV